MNWVSGLAYIQTGYETACLYLDRLRRMILLPLVQAGGYDMILLKKDIWLNVMIAPATAIAQPIQCVARYDSEKHTIFIGTEEKTARWPWLSVVSEGRDLSDFFSSLRITKDCSISNEAAMYLFAHQKGWFPDNELEITLRDGSVEKVNIFSQPETTGVTDEDVSKKIDEVNHIR